MTEAGTRERALDELIAAVACARPRLIDAWETAAIIESLGYTDARIRREFGFPDTAALGAHVFNALAHHPAKPVPPVEPVSRRPIVSLFNSVGASLVYALPWLITFIVERLRPEAMRLPGNAGPPLSLALMFSLIVSGGFIQAISRRGQFYIGLKQPGLAALVTGYLLRLGAMVAVAAAATGLFVGWYFNLFSWPYLVLWADEFLLLCALWMTCGVLAIREEHWRVPLAFALGGLAFVIVSATGRDALLAQMIGAGTVLTAAAIQVPRVFTHSGFEEQPSVVPLPRMTVLLYRTLPFFWYGTLYFCFLFADRLAASASVSALTGAPFGLRPQYKLGMDLALLTFLFAAAGVEYGNIRFTDLLTRAMRDPFDQNARVFQQRVSRIHLRVLGIVVCGFIPIAAIVGTLARRLLPGEPEAVWTTVAIGDVGYLLLAIGLANALALFSLNRPWSAVKALTAGLIVNLTVGYVLSHMVSPYFAAAGLVAGAFVLAVESSVAVRRTIRSDGDHAVSSAV
ncbi:MAG: hypothetical protein AUH43_10195 [Acidobacteria bacterium 13_1_40CM_65_14]|nr:MAG: hypothetical protein AUH43_10195 [Acidobacteria bacterium 13_1_40CM_65_14]